MSNGYESNSVVKSAVMVCSSAKITASIRKENAATTEAKNLNVLFHNPTSQPANQPTNNQ
jgi:hypothetical protein